MSSEFLTLINPLIAEARARLRAGIDAWRVAGYQPLPAESTAVEKMLFGGVRHQLEQIVTPTLALEINVARLRGELRGETPEQRFEEYIALLARPDFRASLAAEYPALFQLAADRLNVWGDVSLELLGRLIGNWAAIRQTIFGNEEPGELTGMRFTQRTTKRGGRSVVALTFAGGGKLIYKPRSLAIEARFQDVLAWLNRSGFEPDFKPVRLLDLESHGWMEWIEPADCPDEAHLRRFYRRQGAYLALFYALEATDVHMSNIIAVGEYPLLIDMEALFHPRQAAADWPPLEMALDEHVYYSVLRSGLLPEPEKDDDDHADPLDLSGLAGAGGQLTPYDVTTWKDRKTDAMHLSRERQIIKGSHNLPTLQGRPVYAGDYLDDLDEGFCAAYSSLAAHKAELLAPGGLLAAFAAVESRVLPRSGRNYGEILEAGYHPDLMRRPAARAHFFTQRLQTGEEDQAELNRLVPHEVAALVAGDVPIFVTQAASRDVMAGEGTRIPDFLPRSGLEMARQRVAALDEADLARQRWFIRASFATIAPTHTPALRLPLQLPAATPPDLRQQALAAAWAIGEWLAHSAVQAGDELSWVGLEPDEAGHWFIEPLSDDLGYGLPGVALFLGRLAAQTGTARWQALAGAAVNTTLRYSAEDRVDGEDDEPIGLLYGLGGRLFALSPLAAAELHPDLPGEIRLLIAQTKMRLAEPGEEEIGLSHGLAGCLTGLLAAHSAAPQANALAVARKVGDQLLAQLRETPADIPDEPFAAYYHGPSGAIAPLLALSAVTGVSRYRNAAEKMCAALLERPPADPGLWLSYLAARPWLPEPGRQAQDDALRRALPELAAREIGRDHSLWSGDMAVLDLLWSAARALDDRPLNLLAGRYAAAVVQDIHQNGWRTAVPLALESPGFAAGLAGIGYGLLRMVAPEAAAPFAAPAARLEVG